MLYHGPKSRGTASWTDRNIVWYHMNRDFRIIQMQAAVFTPGSQLATTRVLVTMLQHYGELFDGDPFVLPTTVINGVPIAVPPGMPSIVLRSKDDRYRFQVAADRADIFWLAQDQFSSVDPDSFVKLAKDVLSSYIASSGVPARVGRMALVTLRVAPDKNPAQTIAEYFCKPEIVSGPLDGVTSIELATNRVYPLRNEFVVNSIVKCRPGISAIVDVSIPDPQFQLVVEQDINTIAEVVNDANFTVGDIEQFLTLATQESEATLYRYFPGDKYDSHTIGQ